MPALVTFQLINDGSAGFSGSMSFLFGSPDEIAAKLAFFRDAGVTNILLNNGAGSRDHLRRFAREVMPAFSESAKMREAG